MKGAISGLNAIKKHHKREAPETKDIYLDTGKLLGLQYGSVDDPLPDGCQFISFENIEYFRSVKISYSSTILAPYLIISQLTDNR